ncbi:MAG TPA: ASKHA domain-containing protein [Kineosporiaceae bacterium]|nr:ASKHA domain-containing protein [Kineosporiaceae bacterium]
MSAETVAPEGAEPRSCRVDLQPVGKRAEVPAGSTVMDAARRAGVGITSVCGGQGTCGRCRVVVTAGPLGEPVDADLRAFTRVELDAGHRLACRTPVTADLTVALPRASLLGDQRLQLGAGGTGEGEAAPAPAIRVLRALMDPPSLTDQRGDLDRLGAALRTAHGVHAVQAGPAVIGQLSRTARDCGWDVVALLHGRELVGVLEPGRTVAGMAVDLGTTKVAGYLIDLTTGAELAAGGVANPQIPYGEDVVSRLAHAGRAQDGAQVLAEAVRRGLDELAGELAGQAGLAREQIAEVVVVANTAMHHLLFGLPTRQLAASPFVAATSAALQLRAQELGIRIAPGGLVHSPPIVGGFVGADAVAMVLACELDESAGVALGVDIGTNTEIVLRHPRRAGLTATSCASGPAFEGAHIRDGMRAADGAIEAVRIGPDGRVALTVIGGGAPVGICGSGIVDAIAELRRVGALNGRGRFVPDRPGVGIGRDGLQFVLAAAEGSATGQDIAVTQADVNEIQLAKGAVQAAITALLDATGTDPAEVDEMLIAGAFGSYLNLDSALDVGLLPRLPNAVYRQVGNAAGAGARAVLRSTVQRARARRIAVDTGYLELTTLPGFQARFARAMGLPAPLAPDPAPPAPGVNDPTAATAAEPAPATSEPPGHVPSLPSQGA